MGILDIVSQNNNVSRPFSTENDRATEITRNRGERKRVGLIGFGAIGRYIVANWRDVAEDYEITVVLARSSHLHELRAAMPDVTVTDSSAAFLATLPEIVVEAAGHEAAQTLGPAIVEAGSQLYLLSVGVIADEQCAVALRDASRKGAGRVCIPAGALAGFDGLMALHASGLRQVHYVSRKPAFAWAGTPGEDVCDLTTLKTATVLFTGTARAAAKLYPKNANLAAAVALAGIGLDETRVTLVADPTISENIGSIEAEGTLGRLSVQVSGEADANNPKTSAVVGASVLSALANRAAAFSFA